MVRGHVLRSELLPLTTASAWAPGTWGELVQGVTLRGERLLVSLPSQVGARAWVCVREDRHDSGPTVRLAPGLSKTQAALRILLRLKGHADLFLRVTLRSGLVRGVGQASSSADLLAALSAASLALGMRLDPRQLCELAAQVEPTNPTLLPGACLFDPDRGRVLGQRALPGFAVRVLAQGVGLDTRQTRQRAPWTRAQRRDFEGLLQDLDHALAMGCRAGVARVATESALRLGARTGVAMGEHLRRAMDVGALGIAASHSGTSVVALFDPQRWGHRRQIIELTKGTKMTSSA